MLDLDTLPGLALTLAGLLAQNSADLPADILAAVLQAQGQLAPYDRFVRTVEALHAGGDATGAAWLPLLKATATFMANNLGPLEGPTGAADPSRAAGIARAAARRLGLLTAADAPPADDPRPLPQFVPPANPPAP